MIIAIVSPYSERLATAVTERLPAGATLFHAPSAADLPSAAWEAEVVFGAPDQIVPMLAELPSLRWVQSTWAGVTPFFEDSRRDYLLTGVKDLFGAAMSEYVLGWVLALKRSILTYAAARRWDFRRDLGLGSLRLGIAGTGSIGAEVARRSAPFFAEVVGLSSDGRGVPEFSACYATSEREGFTRGLDVLAMVLPDTPGTDKLIGAGELGAMNEGAIVINGGRANSLNLPAALQGLERGHLSALVLDVFEQEPLADDDPLWGTKGVYITSHSAAPTDADAVTQVFLANLERYCAGLPLEGLIDYEKGY